jgi:uncharacterized protein (DUF2237 family)
MAILRYDEGARNVRGGELTPCSLAPVTGFFRNGCCETGPEDTGLHTVCAVMTAEFLRFSKLAGNDLSTPQPDFGFPGLRPGGRRRRAAGGPGGHPRGDFGDHAARSPEGPRRRLKDALANGDM